MAKTGNFFLINMNPIVSILIPVFNRENLIGPCIESALNQTFSDFEIVIIDNASSDNTWEVCCSYAQRDSRIKIFQNSTNIGPVRNWQRCIQEAKGKFGKILFSDDLIYPQFLEKMLPFLEDEQVGFVFSSVNVGKAVPASPEKVEYLWKKYSGKYPSQEFIMDALFGSTGALPVSPGAALFRIPDLHKNLRLEIPSPTLKDFPNHGAGPDLLLYLLTAATYPLVVYVSESLVLFRVHESSITIQHNREKTNYLASHYLQAKIWFAHSYFSNNRCLQRLLARTWIVKCCKHKKCLSPNQFMRDYLFEPPKLSFTDLLWSFWSLNKQIFQKWINEYHS